MKAYGLIGYLLLVVLGLGFALSLLTWLSMPGDRLGAAPYIWFLLPAILLTILFFLLPKISRTRFNVTIFGGGTLLVVGLYCHTGCCSGGHPLSAPRTPSQSFDGHYSPKR